jgi:hypothetical protein
VAQLAKLGDFTGKPKTHALVYGEGKIEAPRAEVTQNEIRPEEQIIIATFEPDAVFVRAQFR